MTGILAHTVDAIRPPDAAAMASARAAQVAAGRPDRPDGPAVRLAGLAGVHPAPIPAPSAIVIFAGDHGVHAAGVGPQPQADTARRIAAVLDSATGATVVDVGVVTPLSARPGLIRRRVRAGTRDFTAEPALTRDEVRAAVEIGIAAADNAVDAGAGLLIAGDIGTANTAPALAVITALTPQAPGDAHLAGAAAAADPWQARLHTAVRDGLARHRPDPTRPLAVLAAVGGLEHAAITGFILGAAAHRVPVVTDGVVAGSAALVATALAPAAAGAIFSGDGARALLDGARSVHPGPAVPR